jgi:hypothetical protein
MDAGAGHVGITSLHELLLPRRDRRSVACVGAHPYSNGGEYTYIAPPTPRRIRKTFNPLHHADFLSSASMAPSLSEVPTALAYQNGCPDPLWVADMVNQCFCELNDELVAVWARDTSGLHEKDNHTIPLLHLP